MEARMQVNDDVRIVPPDAVTDIVEIELWRNEPPTPAELEQRRAAIQRIRRRRKTLPPLGMTTDELIHLVRTDDDERIQ